MPRSPTSTLVRFAATLPAMSVVNEKARRIVVSPSPDQQVNRSKGAHWKNDRGTAFANPWDSFQTPVSDFSGVAATADVFQGAWDLAKFIWAVSTCAPPDLLLDHTIPLPRCGLEAKRTDWCCRNDRWMPSILIDKTSPLSSSR